jgi:two-component system, NarL family, response regulator NreC
MRGMGMRVVALDSQPLFRVGLVTALRDQVDVTAVGTFDELRSQLHTPGIDAIVLDLWVRGSSGISVAQEIRDLRPGCRVLVLSTIEDVGVIADMLRAGACGYALKTQPIGEIVDAIRCTVVGERYLPPHVDPAAVDAAVAGAPSPLAHLTRREREVFELVIRGNTSSEIAGRLFIALRTVETHRQRIVKKLSARSLLQLQLLAVRHGQIA